MTNPPYIMEHLEEIAKILRHPRVYSFLHIPVQAGSDSVLTEMKREYCVADFCHVVEFLREKYFNFQIFILIHFINILFYFQGTWNIDRNGYYLRFSNRNS